MSLTAGPPQPVEIRPAVPSDLHDVVRVRQAQELSENGEIYTTADRLAAEWEALGLRLAERVWVAVAADEGLVACAALVHEDGALILRLWVLPDHRDGGLETALLARAEQQARAIGREAGTHSVRLFAQATLAHPTAQQALSECGFVISSIYEQMELVLNAAPEPPKAIGGVEIRPFAAGHDAAEAVHRADEEAFQDQRGHTPRTFERWSKRLSLNGESYDPSLWLIAWDTGEVAGAALGEVVKGVGWIHHLFVRRPWRRRGLGAALTLSVLGAFYQHSTTTVRLNVDAQSLTNAHQLYRRLGFGVIGTYTNFEKVVPLV